ncbi:MAG TPA: carbonate dehydratase [Candidatus Omnitrophica bacterium]|nr:MAG: carbonic anhydrase [Omnitrophica WOR_2 bacterium GWA2_45_18]HBR15074.1 carbonate dehydratase [Candidatus Omnitrophota bacterium]
MCTLTHLFENNQRWSTALQKQDPEFFLKLSKLQTPRYLWIGCSDSRVPANEVTGLLPGELFVHRNVGNVVVPTDLNCLSVIQYAVDVLKVKDIIVCGHYGCGGVRAAWDGARLGLIDNWLRHIQDVVQEHEVQFKQIQDDSKGFERLCELNVIEQALNVCQTTIVKDAWGRGEPLTVHAWIYDLRDGLLKDLGLCVSRAVDAIAVYRKIVQ